MTTLRDEYSRLQRARQYRDEMLLLAAKLIVGSLLAGLIIAMLILPAEGASWSDRQQGLAQLTAYAFVDYDQSCDMFYGIAGEHHVELNPILGEHPSRNEMLTFGFVGVGLAWVAGELLPAPWGRIVLDSMIASEGWNIEDNALVADGRHRRVPAVPVIVSIRW
jgi:hypothetical protein